MSEATTFEIPSELTFEVLEVLRLAHVYALKDSHPEELGEDFKPQKWYGYETEYADKATSLHRKMLDVMMAQRGISE